MSDLARLEIWDDPAIRDGLSWYLAVAENRRFAKFLIAGLIVTLSREVRGRSLSAGFARADANRKSRDLGPHRTTAEPRRFAQELHFSRLFG